MQLIDRHLDILQVIKNAGDNGITTRGIVDWARINEYHDIPTDIHRVSDIVYRLRNNELIATTDFKHTLTELGICELKHARPDDNLIYPVENPVLDAEPITSNIDEDIAELLMANFEEEKINDGGDEVIFDMQETDQGHLILHKYGCYAPLINLVKSVESAVLTIDRKDDKIAALLKIAESPIIDPDISIFLCEIAQDLSKFYDNNYESTT